MTEDDRMEFLRQSIESRDRWLAKTRAEWKNTQAEIREVNQTVKELGQTVERVAQITQLNFDRLTKAMMGLTEHSADHQRRLEPLERHQDPGQGR